MSQRLLKVIACEIAFREVCHCAALSPNLLDLEFLTQGLHDVPQRGLTTLQERIHAVPQGRYDAILVGYALCGNIIRGLETSHTPLVIPRAHDCITFFLGSKERYTSHLTRQPGTYFYSSGWLECLRRRGDQAPPEGAFHLPTRAAMTGGTREQFEKWRSKYGEEKARYLLSQMDRWTQHYDTGTLITFDFDRSLNLEGQVREICRCRKWEYAEVPGDLGLLQRWMNGDWTARDFLVVPPGHRVMPSYDDDIVLAEPVPPTGNGAPEGSPGHAG